MRIWMLTNATLHTTEGKVSLEPGMVYIFDPKAINGTSYTLDEYHLGAGSSEYVRQNKPIPASYFPKSLTVVDASQELGDMFHTGRGVIVFSQRARALMEERAPGQVEFIP